MKKVLIALLTIVILLVTPLSITAHSGGTDGKGGHSGPNGYHYHHGRSAHDHYDIDGDGKKDCPYKFPGSSLYKPNSSNDSTNIKIAHKISAIIASTTISITIILFIIYWTNDNIGYKIDKIVLIAFMISGVALFITTITAFIAYDFNDLFDTIALACIFISIFPTLQAIYWLIKGSAIIISGVITFTKKIIEWFRDNASDVKGCLMVWIPLLIMLTLCLLVVIYSDNSESKSPPKPSSYDYKAFETWKPDIPPPPEFPFDTYY